MFTLRSKRFNNNYTLVDEISQTGGVGFLGQIQLVMWMTMPKAPLGGVWGMAVPSLPFSTKAPAGRESVYEGRQG